MVRVVVVLVLIGDGVTEMTLMADVVIVMVP